MLRACVDGSSGRRRCNSFCGANRTHKREIRVRLVYRTWMSDDPDSTAERISMPPFTPGGEVTTVAKAVLIAYFDKLADTEGFADTAAKLRKAVLYENQFNDAAIKAALFPDDT